MKKIIFLFCLLGLFSCTRAEKEKTTKVTLVLPDFSKSQEKNKVDALGFNENIAVTELADINCYGLLVSGPEDSMRRNKCQIESTTETFDVGFFAGGFYAPVTAAQTERTITTEIPSGASRVIHLVGFKVEPDLTNTALGAAYICRNFFNQQNLENYMSDPYRIAVANQVQLPPGGVVDVTMTALLDTSKKIGDCRGPDFKNNGGGSGTSNGPPAKIAVQFQDGIGIAAKPLVPNSCVGVKFEVQDANGQRANMNGISNITVTVNFSSSGNTLFTSSNLPCSSGTELGTAGGTTYTFDINNSGDLVLFMKPTNSATLSITNNYIDNSDTSSYDFNTPTPTPVRYALYDLYNNISSFSTNPNNPSNISNPNIPPIYVRSRECRKAYLQFLNSDGVPIKILSIPSTPAQIRIESSLPSGQLKFYGTDHTCSSTGDDFLDIDFDGTTFTYGYGFFYKVIPTTTTSFGFQITNISGGTPIISTGELSSLVNFWKAQP